LTCSVQRSATVPRRHLTDHGHAAMEHLVRGQGSGLGSKRKRRKLLERLEIKLQPAVTTGNQLRRIRVAAAAKKIRSRSQRD
jgi:hypothetical protein